MRITSTVTSSGDRWSAIFPTVDFDAAFPRNADGKPEADPTECLRQLSDDAIQHSSSDTSYLHAVVCNWINNINAWKGENCIAKTCDGYAKTIKRLEHRVDREQFTRVRADWTSINGGLQLRCRIRIEDRSDFAQKADFARLWAWMLAEGAEVVSENLVKGGHLPIDFPPETKALLDELKAWRAERKEADEIRKANENRLICPNHRNGYCSPCKFECPHFKNGRCEELK